MAPSSLETPSVLAVDIGSIHTRALLFDVVDGQYRFISASRVPSTACPPFHDISEGVFLAVQALEQITGRAFLTESSLIYPSDDNGRGVDQLVMTFSTPKALRVAILGLLEDVSLESARRLVNTAHCLIVEQIGLNDHRKPELQIDALVKARPDLVLIAGGTENGATRSVVRLVDLISLAMQVIPGEQRPQVIYAGNQAMVSYVQETLNQFSEVVSTPNIRPDIDREAFGPAQEIFSNAIREIRLRQIGGLQSYSTVCSTEPTHSSEAFARMVRFLSQINNSEKGVLGIDIGASSTTLAAAHEGKLELSVAPIGLGAGLSRALDKIPIDDITRWLPSHIPDDAVRDMLAQKTLFPEQVPSTGDALAVEQALTRQIISTSMKNLPRGFSNAYEPILASGQVLTQAPPAQSLLMLLDSIQPGGITTFVLDPHGLTPALGAIAKFNAVLPVQIVESSAFVNLGTVISPICNARSGSVVMVVRVEYEAGEEVSLDVRQGTLTPLPIQPGQVAKIHLHLLHPMVLDPNRRDAPRSYKIIGGVCGAVIDMRSRPLVLPKDPARRRELLKKWSQALNL